MACLARYVWPQRRGPVANRATGPCVAASVGNRASAQLHTKTPSLAVPLPTVTVHPLGVEVILAFETVAVNDADEPDSDVVFPALGEKIVADSAVVYVAES